MTISPLISLAQEPAGSPGLALNLLAILAASGVVALVARRLRIVAIPLYLVAGAAIGPYALGLVAEGGGAGIASIATVLLMFTVGLHVDVGSLRGSLASIAGATILATAAVALACWPVAMLFGLPAPAALAVALGLSLTSTAVIIRVLEQRRETHTTSGRVTMGVTIMHDLVALVILAAVPMIAAWSKAGEVAGGGAGAAPDPNASTTLEKVTAAAFAVGGIAVMILLARLILPKLMRVASRSAESLIVIAAAVALLAAVVTSALGFSPELGAFIAGFILASTPVRYQIAGQLAPLRDLFMAVFFTAIGLSLPLPVLASQWWALPIAAGLLIAFKAVLTSAAVWAVGAAPGTAVRAGFGLAQASEFSFVVLAVSASAGAISNSTAASGVAVAVLTLLPAAWVFQLGARLAGPARRLPLAPWIATPTLPDQPPAEPETPPLDPTDTRLAEAAVAGGARGRLAIVAGFGPVGRAVVDNLERRGVVVTVIDLNAKTIERQNRLGRAVVFGDASNPEVLEQAGLPRADAVVLTMPDEDAVIRACTVVRQQRPEVFIAARLNVLSRGLQAMTFGADHVVVEEMATAEAMAAQVLLKIEQRVAGEDTGPKLYEFQPR